jgi:methylenetetrahydrofolate reductase (NADPH)
LEEAQAKSGDSILITTPHDASVAAISNITIRSPRDDSSAGKGELNHAATWDEFPNGRFGDFKSPAYGLQDLWDGGLAVKVCSSIGEALSFLNS